jgi:hypothetical protein
MAAPPPAQAAPVVPPVAPVFALYPSGVTNQWIDYSSAAGVKLFKQATEVLPVIYNGDSDKLNLFLETLSERATYAGWDNILGIPDATGNTRNLIIEYGQLSLEEIRAFGTTYAATQTRQAQNAVNLHACLANSLSEEARIKLMTRVAEYKINGVYHGPLFLKIIIAEAHIDTRATLSFIRTNLSNLDAYMTSINFDIEKFNHYVKLQVASLTARGETSNDLLINLFKGYAVVIDQDFKRYISDKQNDYEEGQDINPEILMNFAIVKFRTLKQKGRWNAPSPQEERIIALTAQVEAFKKNSCKLDKGKTTAKDGTGGKKPGKPKRDRDAKFAWKKVPPNGDQAQEKKVDGKTYHWCPVHLAWTIHKPSECHGVGQVAPAADDATDDGDGKKKKNLTFAKALAAMVGASDGEEDEGDSDEESQG